MFKILKLKVLLVLCIVILGCPIAYLGDCYVYRVEGEIYDTGSINKISSVKVRILCLESKLSGPHETRSDNNGHFILKGYGAPYDCELIFEHPEYNRKIMRLNPELREEPKDGFTWVWKVNVQLEPKSSS
jgi:hypothetical protein